MSEDKNIRKLPIISNVVPNTTCFAEHAKKCVKCNKKQCDQWIEFDEYQNCVLIASQHGPHTLQKIGQVYNLSRMRVCQIEKNIFEKIKKIS